MAANGAGSVPAGAVDPTAQAAAALAASPAAQDPLAGVTIFGTLKEKLAAGGAEARALTEDARWTRLTEALVKCGYNDPDAGEFVNDVTNMGNRAFLRSLPGDLGPRGTAVVHALLGAMPARGPSARPCAEGAPAGVASVLSPFDVPPGDWTGASPQYPPAGHAAGSHSNNLFLGKVVAAAVRQDQKALEELTAEHDATDQLRKLVQAAGQGEPLRSLEPDESALRAAASARKAGRFLQTPSPKVEDVGRLQRPLAQTLVQELPRVWAAALEGRVSWGDALNWVGQAAAAAADNAVPPGQAERASAVYATRLLREAYTASKRGSSDAEGRENVARVLGEMDWSLLARCQAEVGTEAGQQRGAAAAGQASAALQGERQQATPFPCRRFLFGNCASPKCSYRHGCPFCRTTGPGAMRCFLSHLEANGRDLVRRDSAAGGREQQEQRRERSRTPPQRARGAGGRAPAPRG